jgi:tRNA(fMet)-specific endonuclease VapC
MICLDTNVVIEAISGRRPQVRERLITALTAGAGVSISAVVLFELRYGIARSQRRAENLAALTRFLRLDISLLPFEPEDADEAGEIRADLARAGTPIGPYDILIAAQARRRSAVLVSANTGEFARVAGLRLEDWLE